MSIRACPKCRSRGNSRIMRIGLLQTFFLPFFGLYPWECSKCLHTFYLRSRGRSHRPQPLQTTTSTTKSS
jgi:hypothetical protein